MHRAKAKLAAQTDPCPDAIVCDEIGEPLAYSRETREGGYVGDGCVQ